MGENTTWHPPAGAGLPTPQQLATWRARAQEAQEAQSRRAELGTAARGCRCPGPTEYWFDRSACPEPCGAMHNVCEQCGRPVDGCAFEDQPDLPDLWATVIPALLATIDALGGD